MEQFPAPDSGRRSHGTLGPRMTAFVVVDVLLLLAFLVVLALFLSGTIGGAATGGNGPAAAPSTPAGATPGESPEPSSAPGVDEAATFALPSGNIACEITAAAAACTIANSAATPPVDAGCTGVIGNLLTVTADGAEKPCVEGALPGVAADGTSVLEYGQSTTAGDFTCTSSSTGVTCQHDPTGKGFRLARAGSELF